MQFLTKPVYLILIGICFLLSIKNEEKRPLKTMLPIFFLALLSVEIVCYYFKLINKNNLAIYNLWFPLEFIFYTYWVIACSKSVGFKNIFKWLLPLYAVIVAIIYFTTKNLYKFNSIAFQLGILLLLPALLYKLYEYLNEPVIQNPLKNPIFWLITGLLFSNLFSMSEFSIQNYLHLHDEGLLKALKKVNIILTDVLYITIIAYFILSWKSKRSPT